jgi:hypothetical protein
MTSQETRPKDPEDLQEPVVFYEVPEENPPYPQPLEVFKQFFYRSLNWSSRPFFISAVAA